MFTSNKELAEERFDFRIILLSIIVLLIITTVVSLVNNKDNTLGIIQRTLKCNEDKAKEITDYLMDNDISHIEDATKYEDYLLIKVTDTDTCKLYFDSDLNITFIIKSTPEIPESEKEIETDEDSLGDEPGDPTWYYHQGDWYPENYD